MRKRDPQDHSLRLIHTHMGIQISLSSSLSCMIKRRRRRHDKAYSSCIALSLLIFCLYLSKKCVKRISFFLSLPLFLQMWKEIFFFLAGGGGEEEE